MVDRYVTLSARRGQLNNKLDKNNNRQTGQWSVKSLTDNNSAVAK